MDEKREDGYVMVALSGQVELESPDAVEQGRKVLTLDGQLIGWRLEDGERG